MAKTDKEAAPAQTQPDNVKLPRVKWDTAGIKSSYANNLITEYEKRHGELK